MDTTQTINILQEAEKLKKYFSPKIISEVNNEYVKLAKIKGEDIPWHNHENEDELFYIIDGSLLMEIENQPSFTMKKGDLFVVPKGVNHRVSSSEDCLIMLIETKSTKHTGDLITPITKSIDNQKY
ncbi:Mannose-6-phosphate isomerase, cupin superfamily [Tenacibaculum mesophilum]|uniref:Cupin domain-containing protein n=2 Tax=Tenacibaculum mesophilum TaxID=104268 RepID=A0ABN5TBH6_9FLAO|nr:cupin domain-containing protein [Tenacibaculum mesophilum]QFS29807.1 cupin domain-containing protein [Tenacibaculum mesophilum]SHF97180.1 Mannose-6-phosphate isomerase, cupin superfamily [Tenacibaculum mesophilum]